MKILVVAARAPSLDAKGDQVRLALFLPFLCARHEITVLCPAVHHDSHSHPTPPAQQWAEIPVRLSVVQRACGAIAAWLRGQPAQAGWFAPRRFRSAAKRAAGCSDMILFHTSRAFVHVSDRPLVVDHIDALSLNASMRGRHRLARWMWHRESRQLAKWERRIAARIQTQIVTSPVDAAALPATPVPVVIPNGIHAERLANPVTHDGRDIDVIFTGDMRYPPNRDAAEWLINEIAPALRANNAELSVFIVGRAATSLAPAAGVEIVSDAPSLIPYLERAKVAVAPLRIGTGVPNKVLEATAAGAAIVLTPEANAGLRLSGKAVAVAATTEGFVAEIGSLLDRRDRRIGLAETARRELARFDLAVLAKHYDQTLRAAAGHTRQVRGSSTGVR